MIKKYFQYEDHVVSMFVRLQSKLRNVSSKQCTNNPVVRFPIIKYHKVVTHARNTGYLLGRYSEYAGSCVVTWLSTSSGSTSCRKRRPESAWTAGGGREACGGERADFDVRVGLPLAGPS